MISRLLIEIKIRVSLFSTHWRTIDVNLPVLRRPGGQAIYVTIEHTKSSSDQNSIMDLFIGSAQDFRFVYLILGNILSSILYTGSYG